MIRQVRVLFLDHAPFVGGAETVLLDVVRRIDRSRFEPVVGIIGDSPLAGPLQEAGVPYVHFSMPKLSSISPFAALNARRAAKSIAETASDESIDLIVSNTVRAHVLGAVAAGRAGLPLIWHLHDDTFPAFVYRRLLSRPKRIVANSKYVAGYYGLGDDERCEVVYNGVKIEEPVSGAAFKTRFGLPPASEIVLNIGRLARWKGQDLFLEAAAEVARRRDQVRFIVAGGYEHERRRGLLGGGQTFFEELKELARRYGIEDRVVFTGHVEDVREIYAASDLIAHTPTRPEPFGRVIVEAMAARVSVVAANEGGPVEIVVDGETGMLVPPRDPVSLAEAIVALLADPARRHAMGEAARRRIRERFDLDTQVRKLESVYLSAV